MQSNLGTSVPLTGKAACFHHAASGIIITTALQTPPRSVKHMATTHRPLQKQSPELSAGFGGFLHGNKHAKKQHKKAWK